jgi:hypothetical protein
MKNYRKAVAALVLTLAICMTAFAGEMHTDIASPAPAPIAASGEIHTGKATSTPKTDMVVAVTLNLLQNFLSLL